MTDDLDVRPMTRLVGAEVFGVDLGQRLEAATVENIRAALLRWKVVFFRDQELDHASHVALGRQFGELTQSQPYDRSPPEGYPEIFTLDPRRAQERDDVEAWEALRHKKRFAFTDGWHTDVTPAVNPLLHRSCEQTRFPRLGVTRCL